MKLLLFRHRWRHPVSGSIHQHCGDGSTSLQWRHPIGPFLRSVVAFNPARRLLHGADKAGAQEKDRHHCKRPSAAPTNNPSLIRLHKLLECEPWLAKARVAGADQQLTASSCNRLARRETEVINRSVQTKKPPHRRSGFKSRSNPHHPAICNTY